MVRKRCLSTRCDGYEFIVNTEGTVSGPIQTNKLPIGAISLEESPLYSALIASLNREIGQDVKMTSPVAVLTGVTQLNNFYYPRNFCSLASKP